MPSEQPLRRAILPLTLLLFLFLFIYACVPQPIDDLRVVQVSRLGASALPAGDSLRGQMMARAEFVWKISLSGDAGWVREVRRHELNSYGVIVRCDRRDQTLFALGPYVGNIRLTNYGRGFDTLGVGAGPERYDLYLPETGRYISEADSNTPMPAYDLRKEPLTLCISIAGGGMQGAYGRSNEVRVELGGQAGA